jgi:toxin ParE1/3/4
VKPVIVHKDAQAEYDEAVQWYEGQTPGCGADVVAEVNAGLRAIGEDPGIGAQYRNTTFRFYRIKRFPYLIYFVELPNIVWVLAIAHGRRRPNYWRHRKP